jgi:uncharacterized phage protein (TIGR01671 family)
MREIEFRGISIESKEFVYGQLFYSHGTGTWKITCGNGWTPSYNNPDEGESTVYYEIDYNTIGQYTGLEDKTGGKVYTGDIFNIDSKIYFVEYIPDQCKYVLTTGKGYDTPNCMDLNCDSIFWSYIIGNIHQHKHLL